MSIKIGDRVRIKDKYLDLADENGNQPGVEFVVTEVVHTSGGWPESHSRFYVGGDPAGYGVWEEYVELVEAATTDLVPDYYAFPGGVRVHQISGHLTSFGGQAVQYIARSTRLDGNNKGDTVENLKKAIRFLNLEIERLEAGE